MFQRFIQSGSINRRCRNIPLNISSSVMCHMIEQLCGVIGDTYDQKGLQVAEVGLLTGQDP